MLPVAQFHPILVHFPITFFLTLAIFDAALLLQGSTISGPGCAARVSGGLAVLSGLSTVATYVTGDLAYDIAVASGVPAATLETHESLGTWTAIFIVVWSLVRGFFWWRGSQIEGRLKIGTMLVEIIGVLLIIVAAYFGGQLVYELGVNVTRPVG
jgi:uncharacterized membrane protein